MCHGKPFHSRSSSVRPPDFGRKPPHCLKKKATPAALHPSRSSIAHDGAIGRALGPLSPAYDCPRDTGQIHWSDLPQKRFERYETRLRIDLPKMIDSALAGCVFHRCPEPDVPRDFTVPVASTDIVTHQRATFCQYLVDMPIRRLHRVEDPVDKLAVYTFVEQVAHRVDEYHTRLLPLRRLRQTRRPQAQIETLFIGMSFNSAPPLGKPLCVAVVAAWSNLRAAGHRVPGSVRPLDVRCLSHVRARLNRRRRSNDSVADGEHRRAIAGLD